VKFVPLKNVLTFIRGVTFKPAELLEYGDNDSIVCLRTKNIQKELDLTDLIVIPNSIIEKNDDKILQQSDILISSANSWQLVGKCVRVPELPFPATLGGFISNLRANSEVVDADYLYHWLVSPNIQHEIRHLGRQTTNISNLDRVRFLQLKIPLPPLETQKQIAQVLATADQLRKDCQQVEQELNALAQSVFLEMFGDPTVNTKQFPIGSIKDLVTEVKYGTSGKADESIGNFPILRMNNITYSGEWNFSSLKYINLDKKEHEKYLTKKGDILFNRTNSRELVGKTAVFREETPMAIAGYLIRVRVNNKANSEYISAYLNSIHGKQTLQHMCKSIVGMANINAQELQKIKILIPPKKLQDEFDNKLKKIRVQRQMNTAQLTEYNGLFNALLQKAFKGELNLKST